MRFILSRQPPHAESPSPASRRGGTLPSNREVLSWKYNTCDNMARAGQFGRSCARRYHLLPSWHDPMTSHGTHEHSPRSRAPAGLFNNALLAPLDKQEAVSPDEPAASRGSSLFIGQPRETQWSRWVSAPSTSPSVLWMSARGRSSMVSSQTASSRSTRLAAFPADGRRRQAQWPLFMTDGYSLRC